MWIPILNLTLGYRSPDWATQPRAWLFTDWLVISANPGLNVSLVTFFCSKAYSWIIFTNTFRTSNKKLKAKWIKLNLLLKLSYLNSNYTPTLGYLNPALNSEAQGIIFPPLSGTKVIEHSHLHLTKQRKLKAPGYLPCCETEHGATDLVEVAWRTDEGGDGVDGDTVQAEG